MYTVIKLVDSRPYYANGEQFSPWIVRNGKDIGVKHKDLTEEEQEESQRRAGDIISAMKSENEEWKTEKKIIIH